MNEDPAGDDPDQGDDQVLAQLDPEETLDEPPVDVLDEGWSPGEAPRGLDAWGVTPTEEHRPEPVSERLRHERGTPPEDDEGRDGDGIGDEADADGELRASSAGEVGDARAGRLRARDGEYDDLWADDAGIDGAGASAEEAAVHVVPDEDERPW